MSPTTSTVISTQAPLILTSTSTVTTVDTTMETGLGALAAISLALFLATLLMLTKRNSAPSKTTVYSGPMQGSPSAQTSVGGTPGPFCIHCGTKLGQGDSYCRICGLQPS